jgi:hypothetical protein
MTEEQRIAQMKADAPELTAISSDLKEKVRELTKKINPIREFVEGVSYY